MQDYRRTIAELKKGIEKNSAEIRDCLRKLGLRDEMLDRHMTTHILLAEFRRHWMEKRMARHGDPELLPNPGADKDTDGAMPMTW